VNRCTARLRRSRRTADVVGMEVRDRNPLDADRAPGRLAEPEARVEERPVHEIAVDMLRAGGQRQRQPPDTVFERYERLFYTPC